MLMPTAPKFVMMGLLLLLCSGFSKCAVDVVDFQECAPVPNFVSETPPDYGAVCDQFLVPNQKIISHDEWVTTQKLWLAAGNGISCVPSSAIANLKKEVEKLCSVANCKYSELKTIIAGLDRMQQSAALAHQP
jgi:hypothetical protein